MSYAISDFWKAFGEARFTKSDLWRTFGHRAFPGFPTPEWLEELGIGRVPWIELAPGKRGGEGYRLTKDAVASMRIKDAKEQDKTDRLNELVNSVYVAIGELRCVDGKKLRWTYFPFVGFPIRHRFLSLEWSATAKPETIQKALDEAATYIAERAKEVRDVKLREIARLDELISKASQQCPPTS